MTVPANPKIFHIVHVDRLASILADGYLWSDEEALRRRCPGTMIGMSRIKERRLNRNTLTSHPGLKVGQCVPFYFCPRSIMLFLIHRGNNVDLNYQGGQRPIIHLQSDLRSTVAWAESQGKRWAFTLSNAGSSYFEDRCDLSRLNEINWGAVEATKWSGPGISSQIKESKQAEFLIEDRFPWSLVECLGVSSQTTYQQVSQILANAREHVSVQIKPGWYY